MSARDAKRFLERPHAEWLAFITTCVLAFFLVWRPSYETTIDISTFQAEQGHAYIGPVPGFGPYEYAGDTLQDGGRSQLLLFENGKVLGPAHSLHADIRKDGAGAFSHWNNSLVFSTSDNTDPRANGRIYLIKGYLTLRPICYWAVIAAILAILLRMSFAERRRIHAVVRKVTREIGDRLRDRKLLAIAFIKTLGVFLIFAISLHPILTKVQGESWLVAAGAKIAELFASNRIIVGTCYVAFLALAIIGICLVPFVRDWRLRIPLSLIIVLSFFMDYVVLNLSGVNLGSNLIETMWRERALASSEIGGYLPRVLGACAIYAAMFAIFIWAPHKRWSLSSRFAVITLVAFLGILGMTYGTGEEVAAFPPGLSVSAQFSLMSVASTTGSEIREPVQYSSNPKPLFKKIVLIVDESVRGDYVSINNPAFDDTPALARALPSMVNFGIATSGANCSAASRLMLRIGLRPWELPDIARAWSSKPTMWQYAHLAGFKTFLIEGYSPPAPLFNSYMTKSEARAIDRITTVPVLPYYRRDRAVAKVLLDALSSPEPTFIAVNKFGVHNPYNDKFSPKDTYDPKNLVSRPHLDGSRRAVVIDYLKAIKWSVDGFFEQLLPAAIRDDTLIIYTSDHGQSMFDAGYDITHCSYGERIANGEAYVPLIAITGRESIRNELQTSARRSPNAATHFEIFPTLLTAMGYDRKWIEAKYGPSLFNVPAHRQRGFLVGTFYSPAAKWYTLGKDGLSRATGKHVSRALSERP